MTLDSRPLLKGDRLKILIDSPSLHYLCKEEPDRALRLLGYHIEEIFDFSRTDFDTDCDALKEIRSYRNVFDNGEIKSFKIEFTDSDGGVHRSLHAFGYSMATVYAIGRGILKKESLTSREKEAMLLVHINMALDRDNEGIFVTENKIILRSRMVLSSRPSSRRNIVTVEEAMEIMDLFAKMRDVHLISPCFTYNKHLWYWTSLRSKIQHYTVSSQMMDAFGSRVVYLLMAVDEIGMQYYSGADNDTMENMLYHFNYFVGLVTGIFDTLALEAKNKYNIVIDGDKHPSKYSLSKKSGQAFLDELRIHNQLLRDHISKNADFINVIYELRELVIHREGLKKSLLENQNPDERWRANVISLENNVVKLIKTCGDRPVQYDPFSLWGMYNIYYEMVLEPYRFTKTSARRLAEFSDEFLRLLGNPNYVQTMKQGSSDLDDIQRFEKSRIGY